MPFTADAYDYSVPRPIATVGGVTISDFCDPCHLWVRNFNEVTIDIAKPGNECPVCA